MVLLKVYIEHQLMQLNTPFDYIYCGEKEIQKGIRVLVDFNGQKLVGFVSEVIENPNLSTDYKIKEIDEIIDQQPLINDELFSLAFWLSKNTISPLISCLNAMLPPSMKPKSNFKKNVEDNYVRIIDASLKDDLQTDLILLKDFKDKVGQYKYQKYKKEGKITVEKIERRSKVEDFKINESEVELTSQQQKAIDDIVNTDKEVSLLFGLTGSGKTEVFLRLTEIVCKQGKQALILVPEISLTPLMVKRFKERFNSIAIYNSSLSSQEKYEQYCLVKENKVKIVVGTRSAVFMPFCNLGLIVIDEEHDNSYKQDNMPKYNAKDVAIQRGKYQNCKVLLASATPTLESYARAIKGVYQLVTLTKRINNSMPTSYLVDMSKQIRQGNYIISAPLANALEKCLENKQQAILLLNRRGFNPVVKCSNCGEVVSCPHCDVALSYHKDENRLVCHVCGYSCENNLTCSKCGSSMWTNYGVGTQRLVEEVNRLFPNARVARMDADSTRKKDAHSKILADFENRQYDILVGTQMIAKGLDFPYVTVVGIFNADGPLARNDYRSVETTFDLIVQASGRSGRSSKKGEVYVQAYDSTHYGIKLAIKQDYPNFFVSEMSYRHALKYPPYSYLIAICFSSEDDSLALDSCNSAIEYFNKCDLDKVLGPSSINKKKDLYRYRIVLKSVKKEEMIDQVWLWYQNLSYNRNKLSIQIDVDPYVLD